MYMLLPPWAYLQAKTTAACSQTDKHNERLHLLCKAT
jgi:hypothetical protein